MHQTPPPTPETGSRGVLLPDAFERWRDLYLHDAGQKLIAFLLVALLLYLLARVVRRQVDENIEDVNRRHSLRKWIGYAYAVLLLVFALSLFANFLAGLGAVLAVVAAGVAVALQDVLKSLVGWIYLSGRSGIEVGTRVEVNGIVGDVIDVGVLKTTLLEVGNLVYGRQSTGRLVTVPNYRLLTDSVFLSGTVNPFVWQEVRLVVTFESDWQRAETILRQIGDEIHTEVAAALEAGFRKLESRYAFKYGTLTPIVYVSLADYGVDLTLRFLVPVRRRRGSVDRVSRRVLQAFALEPSVELAYPTQRVYRRGEGPSARVPGDGDPERSLHGGEEGLPPPDLLVD